MATIKATNNASESHWLGEINVMGKYGFAIGEGALGDTKKWSQLYLNQQKFC